VGVVAATGVCAKAGVAAVRHIRDPQSSIRIVIVVLLRTDLGSPHQAASRSGAYRHDKRRSGRAMRQSGRTQKGTGENT